MTQTFRQLQKQIEVLKAQAEQIRRSEVKEVVAKIKVAIDAYGITTQDLFGGAVPSKTKAGSAGQATAKYSDGKGNSWVGRGKRPRWLQAALASGRKLEEFLSGTSGSAAVAAPTHPFGKKAMTNASGGKFRDSAGNTWSGRGPRPRWLKEALAGGASLADLANGAGAANGTAEPAAAVSKATKKSKGGKVTYRDGAQTWSGRGPRPRWLKAALSSGRTLDEFRA
jgi:DNA-binding protein H-NS